MYVGLAGSASLIDTRALALKDVTAVGVLSASPGLDATIRAYGLRLSAVNALLDWNIR